MRAAHEVFHQNEGTGIALQRKGCKERTPTKKDPPRPGSQLLRPFSGARVLSRVQCAQPAQKRGAVDTGVVFHLGDNVLGAGQACQLENAAYKIDLHRGICYTWSV